MSERHDEVRLARRSGPFSALVTLIGDGLDRSTTRGKIGLAYRYAVLAVGLATLVPVAFWLIQHYPVSRTEQADVRIVRAMAGPVVAALVARRIGAVRRSIARLRAWVASFGTIRRR